VALKPDSTSKVIINDYQNFVDMSTFLEDGKILIKIRRRYMVFTSNGAFLDEAQFDDSLLEEDENSELENGDPGLNMFSARHQEIEKTGLDKLKERRKNDPILNFEGNEYVYAKPPSQPPLSESNKRDILNMSYNNRWWLFYNRMLEQMLIYEFVLDGKDYKFKLRHFVNAADSFLFKHMGSIGVDPVAYFRANLS
jgi:hypothetical protein